MKILLIAHACRPVGGSEPGGAWNWAFHIAAHHEVCLIAHPQYREETEPALRGLDASFRIDWVELPRMLDPWNPARGERGHKLHYALWQQQALRRAQKLHADTTFDLVHQVGLGTVSAPSPFWRLGIPAFWGPIGGGQTAPPALRKYLGSGWKREWWRAARVGLVAHRPALRRTVRECALVLATNAETLALLRRAGARRNVKMLPDCGVEPESLGAEAPAHPVRPETVLMWVGRLECHKALPLALEALARVQSPVKLWVAGVGSLRNAWEEQAAALGVARKIQFLGQVPPGELRRRLRQADGFLFTSLRESLGSVVLEAMAAGLPVIALDHQGVGAFVPSDAGIKVPVTTPERTVAALAASIEEFAHLGDRRFALSAAAWRAAAEHTWSRRAATMSLWYQKYSSTRQAEPEMSWCRSVSR